MEKLLAYLNSLPPDERDAFAKRCETTVGYLRKASSVNQKMGEGLCLRISAESGGAVKPSDLRPDVDWEYMSAALSSIAPPAVEPVAMKTPESAPVDAPEEDQAVIVAVLVAAPKVESAQQPDHRTIPTRRTEIPSHYEHSDIDRRDEEVHGRRVNNGDAVDVVVKGV